jgi:hypothetical protein
VTLVSAFVSRGVPACVDASSWAASLQRWPSTRATCVLFLLRLVPLLTCMLRAILQHVRQRVTMLIVVTMLLMALSVVGVMMATLVIVMMRMI